MWELSEKEYNSIVNLPGMKRYSYFIKKIADNKKVWGLHNESGWALASDDKGNEVIPVWPHERFASSCISGEWSDFIPKSIDLNIWSERWLPGLIKDKRNVSVFPTSEGKGTIIESKRLKADLNSECDWYE